MNLLKIDIFVQFSKTTFAQNKKSTSVSYQDLFEQFHINSLV